MEKLIGLIQEQQESFATDFSLNYLIKENVSYSPRMEETTSFLMLRESAHNKSFEANRSDEEHENSLCIKPSHGERRYRSSKEATEPLGGSKLWRSSRLGYRMQLKDQDTQPQPLQRRTCLAGLQSEGERSSSSIRTFRKSLPEWSCSKPLPKRSSRILPYS